MSFDYTRTNRKKKDLWRRVVNHHKEILRLSISLLNIATDKEKHDILVYQSNKTSVNKSEIGLAKVHLISVLSMYALDLVPEEKSQEKFVFPSCHFAV